MVTQDMLLLVLYSSPAHFQCVQWILYYVACGWVGGVEVWSESLVGWFEWMGVSVLWQSSSTIPLWCSSLCWGERGLGAGVESCHSPKQLQVSPSNTRVSLNTTPPLPLLLWLFQLHPNLSSFTPNLCHMGIACSCRWLLKEFRTIDRGNSRRCVKCVKSSSLLCFLHLRLEVNRVGMYVVILY